MGEKIVERMKLRPSLAAEGVPYAIVGGIQMLLDWGCFVLLTWLGMAVVPANLTGRLAGAIVGFGLNGRYTFAQKGQPLPLGRRHMARFVIGWVVMAVLSTIAVALLAHLKWLWVAWLGKPFVDGGLAVLGFLLSKYWIFR